VSKEEEGEFHTLFGRPNNKRQKIFKYFRTDISKFVKFKGLLPPDSQKKNVQWRRTITTEERLTLTVRLVHVPYNPLSPSPSEQLDTPQKAAAFWLTTFVNVRVVAGRNRNWAVVHRPSRDGRF